MPPILKSAANVRLHLNAPSVFKKSIIIIIIFLLKNVGIFSGDLYRYQSFSSLKPAPASSRSFVTFSKSNQTE